MTSGDSRKLMSGTATTTSSSALGGIPSSARNQESDSAEKQMAKRVGKLFVDEIGYNGVLNRVSLRDEEGKKQKKTRLTLIYSSPSLSRVSLFLLEPY